MSKHGKVDEQRVMGAGSCVDYSNRKTFFSTSSAAYRAVPSGEHCATRGYRFLVAGVAGMEYGTAKRGALNIEHDGNRILQTKLVDGEPQRLDMLSASVAVNEGSIAFH